MPNTPHIEKHFIGSESALLFGAVKRRLTKINVFKSSLQTLFVGGLAESAASYFAGLFG